MVHIRPPTPEGPRMLSHVSGQLEPQEVYSSFSPQTSLSPESGGGEMRDCVSVEPFVSVTEGTLQY